MSDTKKTWEAAVLWLRDQQDQKSLVEACFYDDPLTNAAERYFRSSEWQALRKYLPAVAGRVLDIGAGRGISSYAFAKDGWQVDALEPDSSDIVGAGAIRALFSQSGMSVSVEQTWGETLPFPDATFDVVYGRQVLHHARDLKALCKEASRVLKPGGVFIATREHVISKSSDLDSFLNQHPLHHLYGGEHAYLLQEYQYAIRAAGIKLQHTLKPHESDINLYPETKLSFSANLSARLRLPFEVPDFVLKLYDFFNHTPGRLYSFIGYKNA